MSTHLNPQVPQVNPARESWNPLPIQKNSFIDAKQFASTLAGNEANIEPTNFFSKVWTILTYPFVKIYEWTKWILFCCPKEGSKKAAIQSRPKTEPKVDILEVLLTGDPKAAAKEAAKNPKDFFSHLLDNCLANPARMDKALSENQLELAKFAAHFYNNVSQDDPIFQDGQEIKITEDFCTNHNKLIPSVLNSAAEAISNALGEGKEADSVALANMKIFFNTFLPALAESMKDNPACSGPVIQAAFSSHPLPDLFAHIPQVDQLEGYAETKAFLATLATTTNLFHAFQLDLETGSNLLNLGSSIQNSLKFACLEHIFYFHFLGALAPAQIDELTKSLVGKEPHRLREAIVLDRLKEIQGTEGRADALRIYEHFRYMIENNKLNTV